MTKQLSEGRSNIRWIKTFYDLESWGRVGLCFRSLSPVWSNPWQPQGCSRPSLPVIQCLQGLLRLMSTESVMLPSHLHPQQSQAGDNRHSRAPSRTWAMWPCPLCPTSRHPVNKGPGPDVPTQHSTLATEIFLAWEQWVPKSLLSSFTQKT